MYDLKLADVNHALCKAIRVVEAAKSMVGKDAEVWHDLNTIGREIRDAASECQRVLNLIEADQSREAMLGK